MRKYWFLFKSHLATTLEYRAVPLIWIVIELTGVFVALMAWLAVYRDNTFVGGYDSKQMILYYLLIPFVGALISVHSVSGLLPFQIKDGKISIDLVRPFNLTTNVFLRSLSVKVTQQIIKTPIFVLLLVWATAYFQININLFNILLAIIACFIIYFLNFFFDLSLSYLAFWFDDVWSFTHLKLVLISLLGGLAFPLNLLPETLKNIFGFLPFHLLYYFPISLIQNQVSSDQLVKELILFASWLIFFIFFSRFLWKHGLRRYGAYGN